MSLDVTYEYPSDEAKSRLSSLVGIDDKRRRLETGLRMLLNPNALVAWSNKHHGKKLDLIDAVATRPPLFLLAGDVGVGKTALAESIGDAVARAEKIDVYLYRLSLASRGSGLVGEMTKLVTNAFSEIADQSEKLKVGSGKIKGANILLIDEADALVQTRETNEMHHEDRAGVNAVIRGIDDISNRSLPVAVIMCTNRLSALDPAIQRRAADIINFERPNDEQRKKIFEDAFLEVGFTPQQIGKLVTASGANNKKVAFTFSDLTQRFIPGVVTQSFPDKAITFDKAHELIQAMEPTPKFRDSYNGK